MKRLTISLLVMIALLASFAGAATDPGSIAKSYIQQNRQSLGLSDADLADWVVKNQYATKHNGVSHVYLAQRLAGIEVFNGLINVNVSSGGQVVSAGNRFVSNLATRANTTSPSISSSDAVAIAAANVGASMPSSLVVKQAIGGPDQEIVYKAVSGLSLSDIPVKLMLFEKASGAVRLVWDIQIEPTDEHIWQLEVDAVTGAVLFKMDLVQSDTYKVYAWPAESPNHVRNLPLPPGDGRTIVNGSAANPVASPFGWHDLNGVPGADTVDTTGNNVLAQTDLDNNNAFVPGVESRPVSATRDFNSPLDLTQFPTAYRDAAVTNLFYWNNVLHDIHYLYGFDEAAGNFQLNNYSRGGLGADAVDADAQDGSGTNNANFGTRADGLSPRMQMFVWTPRIANQVEVNTPEGFGPYPATSAVFGPALTETGVTGDVVLANDGTGTTSDGCEAITNVSGKIALIDRGTCTFLIKVQNAQAAGAIAVIVANNAPGDPITMGGDDPSGSVTISSVMITLDHGTEMKSILPANATLRNVSASIPNRDSDLDNGVIAHEYGHGVSTRLTGGPSTVTCLSNEQQAGEGWSDFHALALTAHAGDTGAMPRGIGTYLVYQDPPESGRGIRPFPYSTDMTINPHTYAELTKGTLSVPHGVGSVWAMVAWEMYWAIVEGVPELGLPGAGFRENVYDLTAPLAGNQIALRLVMDGLKFQPCNPSFLDARDAILMADQVNNGGKYSCYIWYAFAKRGMGVNALDGDGTLNVTEDFTRPASCSGGGACRVAPTFAGVDRVSANPGSVCHLTVEWQAATDNCGSGSITYDVFRSTDSQFTPSAENRIASGVSGTRYEDFQVSNGTRYFYVVRSRDGFGNTDQNSVRKSETAVGSLAEGGVFADDAGDTTAIRFTPSSAGGWAIRSSGGVDDSKVYATSTAGNYSDQTCMSLESDTIYLSALPRLTFSSSWAIEPAWDGGIVEVASADTGFSNWTKLDTLAYPGLMAGPLGDTACSNSGLRDGELAFNGVSGGAFVPFVAPLTDYANRAVRIRFVFGSDGATNDLGWFLDDIVVEGVQTPGACNPGPTAVDDQATTAEDTAVTIDVLANDSDDGGDVLTVSSASQGANGATVVNADNTITYSPNLNFHGTDVFSYTISDGTGASDTAQVMVTVTPVNDAPTARDDAATTNKNTSININVLANDSDVDGDALSVTAAGAPSNGTTSVNADGTIRYTARNGFKGTDSFSYTISDGNGGTSQAIVTVTVKNKP